MVEDGRLSAMVHLWEPWWRVQVKLGYLDYTQLFLLGKTENQRENVESNSNVSVFAPIFGQSKTYHVLIDIMPIH